MTTDYVIWWHSKFIDEINREATTIEDITDKVSKTLVQLKALQQLEKEGKIKVKRTETLNPIYIEIIDKTIESKILL
ncbi:MAG: hypothetical protein V1726_06380 [Methanobacteriota archaeon]